MSGTDKTKEQNKKDSKSRKGVDEKKDLISVAKDIVDSKYKHDNEKLQKEILSLKNQLNGMDILLKQNDQLEKEVEKLCTELDQATQGVHKTGYLYKYREREIYYAPKWGLRYFVLQGNKLSYYGDEHERRPRRTIDLSKCSVRVEGTKKNGLYSVFSIYLRDESLEDSLVLRLSSDNSVDAAQWIDMMEQACAFEEEEEHRTLDSENERLFSPTNLDFPLDPKLQPPGETAGLSLDEVLPNIKDGEGNNADDDSAALISPVMLQRVKSSSKVLQKAQSRLSSSSSSATTLTKRNLTSSSSAETTKSGSKLSHLADIPAMQPKSHKRSSAHDKKETKAFPAYKPMHLHNAPSPLSSETRPGEYNYRGFFNLMVIILGLTHCDLIVNNISKYGFKLNFSSYILPPEKVILIGGQEEAKDYETSSILFHFAQGVCCWIVGILLNYCLEKYCSRHTNINERFVFFLNFCISTFNIVMPCYYVWTSKGHPGLNLLYLFQSVILWMKLISYAHCNKDLRVTTRKLKKKIDREQSSSSIRSGYSSGDELSMIGADDYNNSKPYTGEQYLTAISEVKDIQSPFLLYPQNLTLKNLGYFLIAPTLCYQLNYPRTAAVKLDKIFWIVFRLIVIAFAMLFAIEQYIKPTLQTAMVPMSEGDILGILERLLKLSIPSTYVWLLVFYFYFHLWLNLLAEITRFGDRQFYKDWWNAKTIDRYW
jgi:diacylglycerol O-acyltransferase-1